MSTVVDFHSHILPGIDDGSSSLEQSIAMLQKEKPDVIGFQEANEEMQDWLVENLQDYIVIGHGRNENYGGEGTPIAYNKKRFLSRREAGVTILISLILGDSRSHVSNARLSRRRFDFNGTRSFRRN